MLTHLHIRDFAIIDQVELELASGMTALTGETGAGKSILVDALGLALGDRADSSAVRHGRERAEVSVGFDVGTLPAFLAWLHEQGIEAEDECLIRRIVTREGRSRGFINNHPVPMQTLQQAGRWLVDIHGQHEHQSLLRRDVQRELLDDFAGHHALCQELAEHHARWRALTDQWQDLQRAAGERESRLDLLRYQVQELDALQQCADEAAALEEEHTRLHHANRLLETCQRAVQLLYDDEGALCSRLGHTTQELTELQRYDARLAAPLQLLGEAAIQLDEATAELRNYVSDFDLDPQRLMEVEGRMNALHDAARKHRVDVAELPALHARLQGELAGLENGDVKLAELQREIDAAAARYRELAKKLSAGRKRAAKTLGTQVSGHIHALGMPGGRFGIDLAARAAEDFSPYGMEQIEFQVSANPGQPLRPLTKVASGGELSRISLAIQVATARNVRIPTLIFDEVDVGIGGGVAEMVGKQLRTLGGSHQVLCITHLPQVAALAHDHLQVSKQTRDGQTFTAIVPLTEAARCEEIARMLGGMEITRQTRAHAKEMIARARSPAEPLPEV
ncbi:MAG: DNA repair protein RecN [Gammaproteobacteria bacterium]